MPIIQGRCLYNELSQKFLDAMESNGWVKVMSSIVDGVLKKTVNGKDMFIRFGAITANSNQVYVGPLEDYIRGTTGVTATLDKTVVGNTSTAAVHTLTVNTACTAAGTFNIDFSDNILNKQFLITVAAGNTTSIIATNIKNILAADIDIAAAYNVTVTTNIVTITKKIVGDIIITCQYDQGVNGVNGTKVNDGAQYFIYGSNVVAATSPVDYKFYIYNDHVIIVLTADPAINTAINAVAYIGKPSFYGIAETDNTASFFASSNTTLATVKPIKNRTGATFLPVYNIYCALPSTNPGQGDLYYMAPMEIGDAMDGIRGEMQHIYALPAAGVIHGDTITVGNEVYDVCVCGSTGNSSFAGSRVVALFNHFIA
ncbi:hypothetical protein DCCM_0411 [Desulfocucumis palustris]|uniref:Phage protein n=1 Tax=Desulfocucumis palustris TaxID=1898651 RepID=A0A2L2X873_9FIRM|nr:hypothetical protein [Desulfocucumis palustris]GBF32220.1 hypothetical protein DCCM_0411 [Desulfocucumis palustris]